MMKIKIKDETKAMLIEKYNKRGDSFWVGIPVVVFFVMTLIGIVFLPQYTDAIHTYDGILFVAASIAGGSIFYNTLIGVWSERLELKKLSKCVANFKNTMVIHTLEKPKLESEIEALRKENTHLLDILINVTHHEGALEEYRTGWEPIVIDELKRRCERYEK